MGIISDLESCTSDCEQALSDAADIDSQGYDEDSFVDIGDACATNLDLAAETLDEYIQYLQNEYPWWDW